MSHVEPPVALVTGGGAGLGEAMCRLFAKRRWSVFVTDIDGDAAQSVADSLGGAGISSVCDVSDTRSVDRALATAKQTLGQIDCLVNNAGIIRPSPSHQVSDGDWGMLLDVHLGGTFRMARAALPLLARSSSPAVVNVSSICAARGFPGRLSYGAAKAAIEAVTRTLAVEWAPIGMRVNAVAPGFVLTTASRRLYRSGGADIASRERLIPLGRFGKPEEIAEAVLWLGSEASSYVTGQVLAVDGGYLVDGRTGPDPASLSADQLRESLAVMS